MGLIVRMMYYTRDGGGGERVDVRSHLPYNVGRVMMIARNIPAAVERAV